MRTAFAVRHPGARVLAAGLEATDEPTDEPTDGPIDGPIDGAPTPAGSR